MFLFAHQASDVDANKDFLSLMDTRFFSQYNCVIMPDYCSAQCQLLDEQTMSISPGVTKLSAEPLFDGREFCQADQLADRLLSDFEQCIQLKAEHEAVIPHWITSAIQNSRLMKKVNRPIAVYELSVEAYQALTDEAQKSLMHRQHTWLYLGNGFLLRASHDNQKALKANGLRGFISDPLQQVMVLPQLNIEEQCKVLKTVLAKIYHSTQITIPKHSIERALTWQALYCTQQALFDKTIVLIRRAITRLLALQTEVEPVVLLEPHHIAEVLSDWEQVSLSEILRPVDDPEGMRQYLGSVVVAQDKAIEKIVAHHQRRVFALIGPRYSGRHTFAYAYAKFINGHQRFCIEIDFHWLDESHMWHEVMVKHPGERSGYISISALVSCFPKTVFLLTHVDSKKENHCRFLKDFMRCAQLGVGLVDQLPVDFSQVSWLLLFDVKNNEDAPQKTVGFSDLHFSSTELAVNENADLEPVGLAEILYQKTGEQKKTEENKKVKQVEEALIASVFSVLPDYMQTIACPLVFEALNESAQKMIVAKALKSSIRRLRIKWKFPLYFQEEVVHYLFNLINSHEDGLEKLSVLLQEKICRTFQHAFKTQTITDKQAFMLQLNETGALLTAVVVEQPSILQNPRAINVGYSPG